MAELSDTEAGKGVSGLLVVGGFMLGVAVEARVEHVGRDVQVGGGGGQAARPVPPAAMQHPGGRPAHQPQVEQAGVERARVEGARQERV